MFVNKLDTFDFLYIVHIASTGTKKVPINFDWNFLAISYVSAGKIASIIFIVSVIK